VTCDYTRTVRAHKTLTGPTCKPQRHCVYGAAGIAHGRGCRSAIRKVASLPELQGERAKGTSKNGTALLDLRFAAGGHRDPRARQCRVWKETLGRIGGHGNSSKGLGRGRGELWGVVPGNRARQEAWYNCLGLAPASQVLKILQAPRFDQELGLPRAIATCGGVARLAESAAHACG